MTKKTNTVLTLDASEVEALQQSNALTIATVTTEATDTLTIARTAVVDSITRGYGAMREYASVLNTTFSFAWFDVEHTDTSDDAKAINVEKKAFYLALRKGNHTNPSVVWARIRAFGNAERSPVVEAEPVLDDEGNEVKQAEQGESGKDNANRSPMLRNIEELSALYKFNNKQENLDQRVLDAHKHIVQALEALGVNLSMIG